MNQTTNYQLNQWQASDRVLMADFNSDNAKIDAALKALADRPGITKLKTFTTTAKLTGTAVYTMDVSDINWGAWQYVHIDLNLRGSGYMMLYPNNDQDSAYSCGLVTSTTYESLIGMVTALEDGYLSRGTFQIFCQGGQTIRTVTDTLRGSADVYTYDQLQTLHLIPYHSSYYMNPGSTITFWGVR